MKTITVACASCSSEHTVPTRLPIMFVCTLCRTVMLFDEGVTSFLERCPRAVVSDNPWQHAPSWATHYYGAIVDVYHSDNDTTATRHGIIRHGDLFFSHPQQATRSTWRRRV